MSGPYSEEGYQLMSAAFEVYNELGYGMAEEVYQQSLEIELRIRKIPFETKRRLSLTYKNTVLEKTYIPDLFVFSAIVVELKSLKEFASEHEAQLFNYMRIARQPVGYLINFGHKNTLEWKRYVLSDLHQ
ncbi:MAG: GxxExxY protein [Pirellulales bacterium]|nr:GxxExxY protein [Pirellulales bacterium]